jgi:hypothetical protein
MPQAVSRRPRFDPRSVRGVHSDNGTGVSLNTPSLPCQYRSAVSSSLKADSHIPYRAHAAPMPCSDSAVSFVKVRVVAGNIRTASPTV